MNIFLSILIIALSIYMIFLRKDISSLRKGANERENYKNETFVSEQAELIFYLTELEGKQRNKALGIRDEHYENKAVAKKWFRRISQKVHSDKGGNDAAFKTLCALHEVMTDDDFGDDDD
ncbi:MAG: hypothetical protein QM500_09615 [Methylococcales bacterium]